MSHDNTSGVQPTSRQTSRPQSQVPQAERDIMRSQSTSAGIGSQGGATRVLVHRAPPADVAQRRRSITRGAPTPLSVPSAAHFDETANSLNECLSDVIDAIGLPDAQQRRKACKDARIPVHRLGTNYRSIIEFKNALWAVLVLHAVGPGEEPQRRQAVTDLRKAIADMEGRLKTGEVSVHRKTVMEDVCELAHRASQMTSLDLLDAMSSEATRAALGPEQGPEQSVVQRCRLAVQALSQLEVFVPEQDLAQDCRTLLMSALEHYALGWDAAASETGSTYDMSALERLEPRIGALKAPPFQAIVVQCCAQGLQFAAQGASGQLARIRERLLDHRDEGHRQQRTAEALHRLLESEVLPLLTQAQAHVQVQARMADWITEGSLDLLTQKALAHQSMISRASFQVHVTMLQCHLAVLDMIASSSPGIPESLDAQCRWAAAQAEALGKGTYDAHAWYMTGVFGSTEHQPSKRRQAVGEAAVKKMADACAAARFDFDNIRTNAEDAQSFPLQEWTVKTLAGLGSSVTQLEQQRGTILDLLHEGVQPLPEDSPDVVAFFKYGSRYEPIPRPHFELPRWMLGEQPAAEPPAALGDDGLPDERIQRYEDFQREQQQRLDQAAGSDVDAPVDSALQYVKNLCNLAAYEVFRRAPWSTETLRLDRFIEPAKDALDECVSMLQDRKREARFAADPLDADGTRRTVRAFNARADDAIARLEARKKRLDDDLGRLQKDHLARLFVAGAGSYVAELLYQQGALKKSADPPFTGPPTNPRANRVESTKIITPDGRYAKLIAEYHNRDLVRAYFRQITEHGSDGRAIDSRIHRLPLREAQLWVQRVAKMKSGRFVPVQKWPEYSDRRGR